MFNPAFINNNNEVMLIHVFETKILLLVPIILRIIENISKISSDIMTYIMDNHQKIISIAYIITTFMSFCSMTMLLNRLDRNLEEKIQRKKERQLKKEQEKLLEEDEMGKDKETKIK